MNKILLSVAAVMFCGGLIAAETKKPAAKEEKPAAAAEAADGEAGAAAAPEAPKKKPKKQLEYNKWKEAVAVAEAWEQPIIVFIELQGDKASSKIRREIVGNKELFDNLLLKHAVLFHRVLPQGKEMRLVNGQRKMDKSGKPDMDKLKKEERSHISVLIGGDEIYPILKVCNPTGGNPSANLAPSSDSRTPLADTLEELKSALNELKVTIAPTPKLEKAIASEKKIADAKKAKRKKDEF